MIKCTRKEAQVAIGLDGGYYGHTAAIVPLALRSVDASRWSGPLQLAARAASRDRRHRRDDQRAARRRRGGRRTDKVLGFVYELVQERTGAVLPREFIDRARARCARSSTSR